MRDCDPYEFVTQASETTLRIFRVSLRSCQSEARLVRRVLFETICSTLALCSAVRKLVFSPLFKILKITTLQKFIFRTNLIKIAILEKILWELESFADRFLEKCRAREPAASGSSNRRGRSSRFPGKLHTQHLCTACSLLRYELNPRAREDFLEK
jgi:hypothetical protein